MSDSVEQPHGRGRESGTVNIPQPEFVTTPDITRLACRDHRPSAPDAVTPARAQPPLLLMHGLAGHMGEWDDILPLLRADGHRVVTYDARGHGASTRRPRSMTRAACVQDALALVRELSLAPVTLLGQSLGGHTALLAAAAHPDLVHALILIEAGPAGANPAVPSEIAAWLDSWPTPFKSPSAAAEFFGHEAWARGLEEYMEGWRPRVDRDTMVAAVTELASHSYWPQWDRIRCPTLVIRGANGTMPESEATQMKDRRPTTTAVHVIPDASHDVHLDRPAELHATVTAFLTGIGQVP
ncbi:alpha/beta fold hydrolase [Streptomyces sp. NBC_00658]|uniref:alpha/beta fold hydrolase n=1 Tax=Streptomyces sp. NBC_00658 TaxID=2975800 RepID=UPI003866899A